MTRKKSQMYARLDTSYRDLLVPMHLLEQLLQEAHTVQMTYNEGKHVMANLRDLERADFHTQEEVDFAIAQQKLEGEYP